MRYDVNGPSDARLSGILKNAQAGDVVALGAGVYPYLNLYKVVKTGAGVTVEPQRGAAVEIKGINLNESSGWTFRSSPDAPRMVISPGPNNLGISAGGGVSLYHFLDLDLIGGSGGPADIAKMTATATTFRNAKDVVIRGCDVHHWGSGIQHMSSDGVVIAGNRIHDIEADAIRGGGTSNILIDGNEIFDLHPLDLTHKDAIQFWTANTSVAASNITIRRNRIRRGAGRPVQGIVLFNENKLPWVGLVIEDNLIQTGNWHGITVDRAASPIVRRNFVGGFIGATNGGQQMTPGIKLTLCTKPEVTDNVAPGAPWNDMSSDVKFDRNVVIPLAAADDYKPSDAWWAKLTAPAKPAVAAEPAPDLLAGLRADVLALAQAARKAKAKNAVIDQIIARVSA